MYYNQSCGHRHEAMMSEAAKGNAYGNRSRHLLTRSMQRASVNIYKTENSYEMLVFAPGRIKENFSLSVNGNELIITYTPPEGFPRPGIQVRPPVPGPSAIVGIESSPRYASNLPTRHNPER